jgi:two-component system response regulator
MPRPAPVLYAEDEENDVFFMQEAWKRAEVRNPLIALPDGAAVIDYLNHLKPKPSLLLMDLKMPRTDGFAVLAWLKKRRKWRDSLPVIVLSSSGQEKDIKRALDMGAHEYLMKPNGMENLVAVVRALKHRWLEPLNKSLRDHE